MYNIAVLDLKSIFSLVSVILGDFRSKLCVIVVPCHQEIEPDDDKLSLERVLLQIL